MNSRFSIKQKITVFILISSLVAGMIGLGLAYWSEYTLLRQTIGRDYMIMTRLLAKAMDRIIDREIKSTEVFMSATERLLEVEKSNLKYTGLSTEVREAYLKIWMSNG